jgi:hypothetical protein
MRAMRVLRALLLSAAVVLCTQPANANPILDWTFDTIPSGGSVTAPSPGLAQWGYTITNLSDKYLVLDSFNQDPFTNGTGADTFNYPILAPFASATGTLFDFLWDPGLPDGTQNTGLFYLTASFYDGDPFLGGTFFGAAPDKNAPYTVTVDNAVSPAAIPEPGTLALLGLGLCAAVAARRRQASKVQEI